MLVSKGCWSVEVRGAGQWRSALPAGGAILPVAFPVEGTVHPASICNPKSRSRGPLCKCDSGSHATVGGSCYLLGLLQAFYEMKNINKWDSPTHAGTNTWRDPRRPSAARARPIASRLYLSWSILRLRLLVRFVVQHRSLCPTNHMALSLHPAVVLRSFS